MKCFNTELDSGDFLEHETRVETRVVNDGPVYAPKWAFKRSLTSARASWWGMGVLSVEFLSLVSLSPGS